MTSLSLSLFPRTFAYIHRFLVVKMISKHIIYKNIRTS